jgi:hypothetical protein
MNRGTWRDGVAALLAIDAPRLLRMSTEWTSIVNVAAMLIAVVIVWSLVFGVSPGLALLGIAASVLLLDRRDPSILDTLLARATRATDGRS